MKKGKQVFKFMNKVALSIKLRQFIHFQLKNDIYFIWSINHLDVIVYVVGIPMY